MLENPIFVRVGQILTGRVNLKANTRQSYDVTIEVGVEGSATRSSNTLDLKNPYFRYTGQAPQPPPGGNTASPSEKLWSANVHSGHSNGQEMAMGGGMMTHSGSQSVPSVGLFGDYVTNGLNGSMVRHNVIMLYQQLKGTTSDKKNIQVSCAAHHSEQPLQISSA